MNPEEVLRQRLDAWNYAPFHLQLRVQSRFFPTREQLLLGDDCARIETQVATVFRSAKNRITNGDPLTLKIPHCFPEAMFDQFALFGAFNIPSAPLATASFLEVLIDRDYRVVAAHILPIAEPTSDPRLTDPTMTWMTDLT